MIKIFSSFSKTLVWDKANFRFAIGVWLGLAFSIAVILSTIGIMDGFVSSMRKGLRQTHGDLYFYSRSGFFKLNQAERKALSSKPIENLTGLIESQAFLVHKDTPKGVSVKGIVGKEFSDLTSKTFDPEEGSIIIGDELSEALKIKEGDEVVLVLARGNAEMEGLPLMRPFKVQKIIDHGIYQQDMRFVYMDREELSRMLDIKDKVNMYALNLKSKKDAQIGEDRIQAIKDLRYELEDVLGIDFRVKPYWYDFASLLEAVEIEKLTIGLVLQIIVVISIFNVLSFVTFLSEKKSREIFLFQALGMSGRKLSRAWFFLILTLWAASCAFSLFFVKLFDYLLGNLPLLNLPGEVYSLGRLQLSLDWTDYLLVFSSTLLWLFIIVAITLYRMNKKSILHGLRKEFN